MSTMDDVKKEIEKCDDKTLLGGVAFFNVCMMDAEDRAICQPVIDLASAELDLRLKNGTRTH